MFGIGEFLQRFKVETKDLSEQEKFLILRKKTKKLNPKVVQYLVEILDDLYIEVMGIYEGTLFELMVEGKLMSWCWQTTETAIVFFNNNDYIERGNLYIDKKTPQYYHSWICFTYDNEEYILDPCLTILCKKKEYEKMFNPNVKAKILAKDVKEELIKQITNAPEETDKSNDPKSMDSLFKMMMGEAAYYAMKERKKVEVEVDSSEDINAPLYRNGSGYKAEIKNNKIKKLKVHFYDTEG